MKWYVKINNDIILKFIQYSFHVSISACISFGKQLHPYQIPACRNLGQILLSDHIHLEISLIFAPTFSAKFAISLIKLSFVAKKELAAYLIISADLISVNIILT